MSVAAGCGAWVGVSVVRARRWTPTGGRCRAPGLRAACVASARDPPRAVEVRAGRREVVFGGGSLAAAWGVLGGPGGIGLGVARAEADTAEGMLAELEEIKEKIATADKGKESVVRLMDEVIEVQGRIKSAGLDKADAKKVMLRSAEVKAAIRRLKF